MKILKLSSKSFAILLILYFSNIISFANEPVDFWKIKKIDNSEKVVEENNNANISNELTQNIIIEQQNETVIIDKELDSSEIKVVGLYEPSDNGLSIDMWSNSSGLEIKETLKKINEKKLSNISEEILDIVLLTNSYNPVNNISSKEFLDFKIEYLEEKKDFELIKKFLIKNPKINNRDRLIKFYTDYYLTNSQIEKSCEIFDIVNLLKDEYLINFKITCLVHQNKKEEAQLLFDLKSELGNVTEFFEKKFNVLMGYENNNDILLYDNILNLYLSHKTNKNFSYEPNLDTPKFIWKYLSTSNLLKKTDLVDLENADQIKIIEKATNDQIYEEKELLDLYKRFQFDINQLLNVKSVYKNLPDYEGRALLYQRLLLAVDTELQLDLSLK